MAATAIPIDTLPSINPATGERLAAVAEAGPEDVDAAVSAARKANNLK